VSKRQWKCGTGLFPLYTISILCCFVLLIPTPEEYRVPRVNPGVTASKLSPPLLPSLATPGPPLPYRPLQLYSFNLIGGCNDVNGELFWIGSLESSWEMSGCLRGVLLISAVAWLQPAPSQCATAAALRAENGMFSPVDGGKTLRFSGAAAAVSGAWPSQSVALSNLQISCIFVGRAFDDEQAQHQVAASVSGDLISCATPVASTPHVASLLIVGNGTVMSGSIEIYFYAILSFLPTVGMADGATEITIHVAGYPQGMIPALVVPACRFDAGPTRRQYCCGCLPRALTL